MQTYLVVALESETNTVQLISPDGKTFSCYVETYQTPIEAAMKWLTESWLHTHPHGERIVLQKNTCTVWEVDFDGGES